jgi:hypothetical protein
MLSLSIAALLLSTLPFPVAGAVARSAGAEVLVIPLTTRR